MPPAEHPIDIGYPNADEISPLRTVIHNRYYTISGTKYWVEVSFYADRAYLLLFDKHGSTDYLALVMPLSRAEQLLESDDNESEVFIRRLVVRD